MPPAVTVTNSSISVSVPQRAQEARSRLHQQARRLPCSPKECRAPRRPSEAFQRATATSDGSAASAIAVGLVARENERGSTAVSEYACVRTRHTALGTRTTRSGWLSEREALVVSDGECGIVGGHRGRRNHDGIGACPQSAGDLGARRARDRRTLSRRRTQPAHPAKAPTWQSRTACQSRAAATIPRSSPQTGQGPRRSSTAIPAAESIFAPPEASGFGSGMPMTTRATPAAISASTQGGVLP